MKSRSAKDRVFDKVIVLNTEAKAADYLRRVIRADKAMILTDLLFNAIDLGDCVSEASKSLKLIGARLKIEPVSDE